MPSVRSVFAGALLAALASTLVPATASAQRWYRGNTHVHTTNSDGNGSPEDVARWYRDGGYDFLVVTDHETIMDVAPLNALPGTTRPFLVIAGQEITQQIADARADGNRHPHVNQLGARHVIMPLGDKNVSTLPIAATYARTLAAIRADGAIATLNHPNFRWSVGLADMVDLPDSTLFELWNGQPRIDNLGGDDGAGHVALSTEALWDSLLTRGKVIFGVASDDAHHFRPEDTHNLFVSRPGNGWVFVRADTLTPSAILDGLRHGDFYSSNGVTLADYSADAREIRIEIAKETPRDARRYVTRFIGSGGRVLAEVAGLTPSYRVRGDERYVRATITDSNGRHAWTQPIWVARRR